MKTRIVLFAFIAVVISGCSTTATLYPIKGPMSTISPLPTPIAKVNGILGNSGTILLVLPDGEVCKGRWSSIAPMSVGFSAASASGSATSGLSSVWATVYGSDYSLANVPGINKGEAMLVGDKGTVIQIEFYTGSGTANGTGVAKDNKGNIYKVLF